MSKTALIMAGCTGGHIFPALAVAKVLRARGVPVVWLGADGAMETRLVPQHGIELDTLAITGLRGKGKLAAALIPVVLDPEKEKSKKDEQNREPNDE